eukprot:m.100735 g.100735  ORF g.100735 m.100735 type:complete len:354 (+) comp8943_c0_seq2:49-1110(+)
MAVIAAVCGTACAVLSAKCFLHALSFDASAQVVLGLTEMTVMEAIKALADTKAPDGLLVAVRGLVGSDAPLQLPMACAAHLRESFRLKTERLKDKQWHPTQELISRDWSCVPFFLKAYGKESWAKIASDARINVPGALTRKLQPGQLPLETHEDIMQHTQAATTFDAITGWLSGERVVGFRTVVKVLPLDSNVMIIGKIRNVDGNIELSPSTKLTFFTRGTVEDVAEGMQSSARIFRILGFLLGLVTIGCVVFIVLHRRRSASASASPGPASAPSLPQSSRSNVVDSSSIDGQMDDIDEMIDDSLRCIVCDRRRNAILQPCGHVCTCQVCALQLSSCPICRSPIERIERAFIS